MCGCQQGMMPVTSAIGAVTPEVKLGHAAAGAGIVLGAGAIGYVLGYLIESPRPEAWAKGFGGIAALRVAFYAANPPMTTDGPDPLALPAAAGGVVGLGALMYLGR